MASAFGTISSPASGFAASSGSIPQVRNWARTFNNPIAVPADASAAPTTNKRFSMAYLQP